MKQPKFIKQLIENYNEKQYNKPKYLVYKLFVAKINKPRRTDNILIKDFVICEYCPNLDSSFRAIDNSHLPYDYVIGNVHPFHIFMEDYMKKHRLTMYSQISLKQIAEIEKELNENQEYLTTFNK